MLKRLEVTLELSAEEVKLLAGSVKAEAQRNNATSINWAEIDTAEGLADRLEQAWQIAAGRRRDELRAELEELHGGGPEKVHIEEETGRRQIGGKP